MDGERQGLMHTKVSCIYIMYDSCTMYVRILYYDCKGLWYDSCTMYVRILYYDCTIVHSIVFVLIFFYSVEEM